MADTIDSISIELTASTQSAERSIQRVIDMLYTLNAMAMDTAESKISKSIRSIAKAAREIDSDAGQKLARLAGGLKALSKVGDLSNLADAGKNLSGVVRAVNSIGQSGGKGLSGLANGIKQTSDALGSINDADVSKLGAVRDALSGEMRGSLHQANQNVIEHPALGGSVAQNYDLGLVNPGAVSIYERIAYAIGEATAAHREFRAEIGSGGGIAGLLGEGGIGGAITVFTHVADSIRDAAGAYREFQSALGSGSQPIFSQFADGAMTVFNNTANGAMSVFKYTADSIMDATAAYREFRAALGSGVPPIFTEFAEDVREAASAIRQLKGETNGWTWGNGSAGFDWASAWAARQPKALNAGQDFSFGGSGLDQASAIETSFVEEARAADEAGAAFSRFNNILWSIGNAAAQAGNAIGNVFSDVPNAVSQFIASIKNAQTAYDRFMASLREVPVVGDVVKAFDKIRNAITGFFKSVVRIAKYRLIRSLIRTITEGFSEGTKNLYAWSDALDGHFAASMDRLATSTLYLKNALGTLVGPLMEALEPALSWIIDRIVDAINYFNMFVAAISGKSTYTAALRTATTWGDSVADSAGKAAKGVKDSVDDMKRTILGFDEINKLASVSDNVGGGGGSGGKTGSGNDVSGMFEERPLTGGFQEFGNAIETALQDTLSRITLIIGGAELAVGALLALSGANIPLGIALMATGAVTMGSAIVANWDGIPENIKLVIGAIEAAVGTALLAVGAILAFSGTNIGLGVALLIAGASLQWSAVTVVWTTLKDKIDGQIQAIGVLLGGATFGLGAVLAFAGHPGLGIAMMIAGASVAAVSINWNYLKEKLQGPIGTVTALISGALLVLGFLAIVGGMIPMGLGLILAGAAGLATTVAANWDSLTDFFSDLWENIKTAAENTWETLKDIGAGIWERIKEGVTGAVQGVGGWIKEHIFQPFIDAWHWLLGLFGGGNDSGLASNSGQITANAAMANASRGSSVAEDIAKDTTDKESIQKLKQIGATMGDAIKQGLNDRLKSVSGEIWNTIVTGWSAETRELPVYVKLVKSGWSTLAKYVGTYEPNVYVKLVKSGWSTLATYVGTYEPNVYVKLVKSGWSTLAKYVGTYEPNVYVKLVKSGWSSLATYVGTYEPNVYVKLVKSGWSTLATYVGEYTATVKVVLEKDSWTDLSTYLDDNFGGATGGGGKTSGGGAGRDNKYKVSIGLKDPTTQDTNDFWTRLGEAWDASVTAVDKGLDVVVRPVAKKAGGALSGFFSKVGEWLFGKSDTPETESKVKAVAGTGFSSVGNDGKMNLTGISDTNATIYLQQGNFSEGYKKWLTGDQYADLKPTVYLQNGNFNDGYKKWVTGDQYADLKSTVYLQNGNFNEGYKKWVTGDQYGDLSSSVKLSSSNAGYYNFRNWLTGNQYADVTSTIYLQKGWSGSLSDWIGNSVTVKVNLQAGGGVAYSNGYSASFASGGVISSGVARHLSNIPHYASGTTDAHGTLFLAGEAGPEILGHVGGRTEILNQSQLASTMFAAVRSAMTGVRIGGSIENAVSMDNGEADYEAMYRAMYDAFTDAMTGSNERDKEKVALMRQIAAKEFTAEVTASSVNRAQTRMNRRAGTTIVPVGT